MNIPNKQAFRIGSRNIIWRQRLWFLLITGTAGAVVYAGWISWWLAMVVTGFALPVLLVITLRSVAVWKMNTLLKAENPKEVLEKARLTFLKRSYLEQLTIWSSHERDQFHDRYEARMGALRLDMIERGAAVHANKKRFGVHRALGNVPGWLISGLAGMAASVIWFRYRSDVTERVIAALLLLFCMYLTVSMLQRYRERKRKVLIINEKGIQAAETFYAFSDLVTIDVVAGRDLVLQMRNGETHRVPVEGLSVSPREIEEAALYFRQVSPEAPQVK